MLSAIAGMVSRPFARRVEHPALAHRRCSTYCVSTGSGIVDQQDRARAAAFSGLKCPDALERGEILRQAAAAARSRS